MAERLTPRELQVLQLLAEGLLMADPASLDVRLTITGLSPDEAVTVFANLPAGSTSTVRVTKPALGPKRYEIASEALSVQGAKDVATALHLRLAEIANGARP